MIGETLGEVLGQNIGTRVLPDEGRGPRMEITDQASGTICGASVTQAVTYVGTMRPNGTIAGEGSGVVMTANGGSGTFRGFGVGQFVRPGVTRWRGSLFYETQGDELARLNGIAVLFEYEVNESGKSEARLFEWS